MAMGGDGNLAKLYGEYLSKYKLNEITSTYIPKTGWGDITFPYQSEPVPYRPNVTISPNTHWGYTTTENWQTPTDAQQLEIHKTFLDDCVAIMCNEDLDQPEQFALMQDAMVKAINALSALQEDEE